MTLYDFGAERRLRCAADYKVVFDGALFKVPQPHFLFLAKHSELPNSRLGLVVAKKKVRNFVINQESKCGLCSINQIIIPRHFIVYNMFFDLI